MIDQVLLNDTLQKINASLNKRFEKDADLYISKQDEYEIKKNLCNEAYGGIVNLALAKGISYDIVLKVLLRNAGVLDVSDIKQFKKCLKPILDGANYRTLSYMMEDVLSDNIYMQKGIKHLLFEYYVNGITAPNKIRYWKSDSFNFDSDERQILFNAILTKVNHKDPDKTYEYRLDFAKDAFEHYPEILKDKNIYCNLKASLSEKDQGKLFKYLCMEMQKPSIDSEAYNFMLVDAYASYGERAFDDSIAQIKSSSAGRFKQYIKVINKLFHKEQDKVVLVRMFDTMERVYSSPYIKRHIQREIASKVWKVTKSNSVLYGERKVKIDQLMKATEQTDKSKYRSFKDVMNEIQSDVRPKSIAYFWVNIKSPDFEKSLVDSFTDISNRYLVSMKETYSYLFDHSEAKGGLKELTRMCDKVAKALHEFNEIGGQSPYYDALDQMWLEKVLKYKLNTRIIKDYMCESHFEQAKEIE